MTPEKANLDVPLHALEERAGRQPKLLFMWGKELARAKKEAKVAKNSMKLGAAQLEMEIRQHPERFELEKATDKSVEAAVLCDDGYQQLQTTLVEAEEQEDVLQAYINSLYDVTKEIEVLSRLHGQMYWAKPSASGKERQDQRTREMERVTQETNDSKPNKKRSTK